LYANEQEDKSYEFDEVPIEYTANGVTNIHFRLSGSDFTNQNPSNFDDIVNWKPDAEPLTEQEELDKLPLTIEDGVLKARYPVNSNTATAGIYSLWLIGTASNNKEVSTTI
jgi:hypothetical protein